MDQQPPFPPSSGSPDRQSPPPRLSRRSEGACLWTIPVGCLSVVLLVAAIGIGIALIAMPVIKSSDAYKTPVRRATTNPQVINALGSPVEPGFFISGNLNINDATGDANLSTSLSGPKDSGKLSIIAHKAGGVWNYSTLNVRVNKTGQTIDLRSATP